MRHNVYEDIKAYQPHQLFFAENAVMINNTFRWIDLEHYGLLGSAVLGIVSVPYNAEIYDVNIEDSDIGIYSAIDANGDIGNLIMKNISISNVRVKS